MPKASSLLTLREAADLIRVHPNTIRNWDRAGKIEVVRIGSRRDRRVVKQSLSRIMHRKHSKQKKKKVVR